MDFAFKHHVEFMFEHLNLSEEVSKEIMDKFAATRVLQVCFFMLQSNFEKTKN